MPASSRPEQDENACRGQLDYARRACAAVDGDERQRMEPVESNHLSVEAAGLVKRFGQTLAVDGISLQVGEGEFFGFLGPNGAGKSTTIRMLCGLLRPDAGQIRVAGHDLAREPLEVKRDIGVLPEETNLYERLTGEEFLLFAGRMYGLAIDEARRRTADLLELMELTEAKDKMIVDYSMGMKKKTALASAVIHRPRVMFLDEPFNGIDPVSVRAIRQVLRQLTDHGTTIFFSSHVMEVVERLCTQVAIINHGRIVGEGTIAELRAKAQAGGDSSLEDIFLKLVDARVDEEALSWL
jgi:ABC-2 type transport system ATP-binding protein